MKIISGSSIWGLLVSCCLMLIPVSDACSVTLKVSPEHISVDSLYHGSKVTITGEVQANEDVIVKVTSVNHKIDLRKKGKRGGLLWMNTGELEIEPVSDVYLVFSTRDIDKMLNREEQNRYMIGYRSLKKTVSVEPVPDEAEKEKWLDEFIKFKEDNRVYGIFPGSVETSTSGEGRKFILEADWPYQAPPQEYRITAYTVKNGLISGESNAALLVEKTGALRFLSEMAFNNAAVYGVVSIFIAVFSGFIVSMVFKGGGGGH